MMLLIDKILDYTYDIVVAIAMIYSIYLWVKKGYTAKQKYFFLYLVAVLIVDVFGLLIRKTFDLPQAYLYFPFIIFSILYCTLPHLHVHFHIKSSGLFIVDKRL